MRTYVILFFTIVTSPSSSVGGGNAPNVSLATANKPYKKKKKKK